VSLRDRLRLHEGEKLLGYKDSRGRWTIGVGHCIETKPIRQAASDLILDHDIEDAEMEARQVVDNFDALSQNRQDVLTEMCFNLGGHGVSLFKRFVAGVNAGDFNHAADEMLDSDWAQQVGHRANELADLMRRG
jgi:lysozyme